jgi:hypothetical protein
VISVGWNVANPYATHMDGRIRALTELVNQSGFDVIESLSLPDRVGYASA